MPITISLTSTTGVSFDAEMTTFFSDITPDGWPLVLGNKTSNFNGDQVVILDQIEAGKEANTKAIILDGSAMKYNFSAHTLSGTLNSVRLATLGEGYNPDTDVALDASEHIANVSTSIEITGLSVSNAAGVRGAFHNLAYALMGGTSDTGTSDPTLLSKAVQSGAHILNGSVGADTYTGTGYNDVIDGKAGNDVLKGAGGNDKITGGAGADSLHGGAGSDTFVFVAASDSTVAAGGRDTIFDFEAGDKIDLTAIDANGAASGNQAFAFIGSAAFSHAAGQLRFVSEASGTTVYGDTDGNGEADFAIHLANGYAVAGSDFLL